MMIIGKCFECVTLSVHCFVMMMIIIIIMIIIILIIQEIYKAPKLWFKALNNTN